MSIDHIFERIGMNRRMALIDLFFKAIEQRKFMICSELCFKCIYGLNSIIQIELCKTTMARYLPIFEYRNSEIVSPREVISNVGDWVDRHGTSFKYPNGISNEADIMFLYSIVSLLTAYRYRDNKNLITSSCACCISHAIDARGDNVWIADDPEGVAMWQSGKLSPGHSVLENAAYIAVVAREWTEFVSILLRMNVPSLPDTVDILTMDLAFNEWKRNEMLLIVPQTQRKM